MQIVDLSAKPYFLSESDIAWVEDVLGRLSLKEKVGQMFCVVFSGEEEDDLLRLHEEIPFGGVTFRPNSSSTIRRLSLYIQGRSPIPCLISANLESGGSGLLTDGTEYASQLEVSATGKPERAFELGDICGREGASVGCNYAFAPVVDVMFNWRNPIVNTRTYGDDPRRVVEFASAYMDGIMKHGFAVALKHFPGDGVDERDQHLVSSVNSFSVDEWDESYGMIYRALIDKGAQTVMVGHIMLPSYCKRFSPDLKDSEVLPASLSYEIVTQLLKGRLDFNGVAITDSASMTGLGCCLPRRSVPAACINAGCDVFLFGRNAMEDFENLLIDAENGQVPIARIDDAVRRILGLKASLGLHRAKRFASDDFESIVGCKAHISASRRCADEAITLVKDTQGLLPLDPKTHKHILLCVLGDVPFFRGGFKCRDSFVAALEKKGFEVDLMDTVEYATSPVSTLRSRYGVIMYVANTVSGGNDTVNRIRWNPFSCGQSPQLVNDIPTMFVSMGNPYHFVDVPMVRTIVNCYNCSNVVIGSLVDKIVGEDVFMGHSPVDPFCGFWGADF